MATLVRSSGAHLGGVVATTDWEKDFALPRDSVMRLSLRARTPAESQDLVLELRRGSLFQPSKARESEVALQSLGVFTGVSVALEEPEDCKRFSVLRAR